MFGKVPGWNAGEGARAPSKYTKLATRTASLPAGSLYGLIAPISGKMCGLPASLLWLTREKTDSYLRSYVWPLQRAADCGAEARGVSLSGRRAFSGNLRRIDCAGVCEPGHLVGAQTHQAKRSNRRREGAGFRGTALRPE